ncbi:hypothetical protein Tco_1144409 [Tanacetum coccineum]
MKRLGNFLEIQKRQGNVSDIWETTRKRFGGVSVPIAFPNGNGILLGVSVLQNCELHENTKVREMLFLYCYAFSVSLLLTPLCCDDIHDVKPRVSALAGCDRLVSEPMVIEN